MRCLCRCFTLQGAVLATQVVVALEELGLCIQRCPTLREAPRLAMQRHHVLAQRPVQAFEQRGRNLLEWDQLHILTDREHSKLWRVNAIIMHREHRYYAREHHYYDREHLIYTVSA